MLDHLSEGTQLALNQTGTQSAWLYGIEKSVWEEGGQGCCM